MQEIRGPTNYWDLYKEIEPQSKKQHLQKDL